MPISREQAHLVAGLACDARPHGAPRWDPPGVVAAIGRVNHLALPDVVCAAMRAAADRSMRTPAPIGDPTSSAWRERIAEPVPTKKTYCRTHQTALLAGVCPSCRADTLAGDR